MIIKTKKFKEVCSIILNAIDNSELSSLTETLELKTENKILYLNVTNGEYYASVKFELDNDEDFHASVNANLFLKLIASITSEDIELNIKDNYVNIKANGNYKIPLIYENDKLLELPKIEIKNKTLDMKISGSILKSILDYNSKELLRGTISRPVQKMFYVDEKGCLTFTSGACVNYFELEKPVKLLFNNRLVKLFKLFKDDMVDFELGYDSIDENLTQTKVSFTTPTINLTAITGCNDDLLKTVPVSAIRNRAEYNYEHNVVINTKELCDALNRLLIFNNKNTKTYSDFIFKDNKLTIYDSDKENTEIINFKNNENIEEEYRMTLDLSDLKLVLDTVNDDYVTLGFGNHQACVVKRSNITNVVPEVKRLNK